MQQKESGAGIEQLMVPVTVLTGLLGAGKTTLLQHILHEHHGKRILVIQNEFSDEMGIESPLLVNAEGDVLPDMYELPNGCMCCSVRDSLVGTIEAVLSARPGEFEAIIVEASGVADPEKVVGTFWVDSGLGSSVCLDGVITLVDVKTILNCLDPSRSNHQKLASNTRASATNPLEKTDDCVESCLTPILKTFVATQHPNLELAGPSRGLRSVLGALTLQAAKQIACANVILVNKCDLASPEEIQNVEEYLRPLNLEAPFLRCQKADVPLDRLLHLNAYATAECPDSIMKQLTNIPSCHVACGAAVENCCITLDYMLQLSCPSTNSRFTNNEKQPALVSTLVDCYPWDLVGPKAQNHLWSIHKVNAVLGELLWEKECGDIYRCKGLFPCRLDDTRHRCGLYALQGVGEVFEIEPISEAVVWPCIQKMYTLASIEKLTNINSSTNMVFRVTGKFLFVGRNLNREHITEKLRNAFHGH